MKLNPIVSIGCMVVIALAASAQAQSGLHRGENLLQPEPELAVGWERGTGHEEGIRRAVWRNAEAGDTLVTAIMAANPDRTPARFREISDEAGDSRCREHDTETLAETPVNGYPAMMWLARCGRDADPGFRVLHYFIAGRDSSYCLTRRWAGAPDRQNLPPWIGYFQTVSVCDTRERRNAPCPELRRVEQDR